MLFPVLFLLAGRPAEAHDARPLSLSIVERSPKTYAVVLLIPPSVDSRNQPNIIWPEGCRTGAEKATGGSEIRRVQGIVSCTERIEGKSLGIRYPLFNPSISTLVRLTPANSTLRTVVLPPDRTEWRVPIQPRPLEVARDYFLLGAEHIWSGVDHLLFVAGLLILARTGRRVLLVVTGFTIAHSITLSLSALGFINMPVAPTEATIAISILFLASEIARPGTHRLASRFPLLVSSSFGLLHGLGFAAALGEIGLPPGEVVTALLFFNLGVEAGQIAFILPFIGLALLRDRLRLDARHPAMEAALPAVRSIAVYGLGILASFWFFQRLTAF